MSGFFSNAFRLIGRTMQQAGQFYAFPTSVTNNQIAPTTLTQPWSFNSFRTLFRDFKGREGKRIKTHGWRARLKTRDGRRVIMRRILKGRYYLTH